jgi:thiamine biosynthesis lipoprotein
VTSTVAFTADALGTTVRVVLTQPDAMTAVAALTRSALAALDAAASRFRDDSELSQARRACWADVVLLPDDSGAWLTVPAGTRLDLGAVAKAWLSDSLAAAATTLVPGGVLVDLGGDLRVTGRPPRDGWVIGLPPGADGQRVIAIQSGGLATSAQDVRRWATTDGPAHHVVDPRTGRPAVSPWRAVSVHAATATEANAASTAALILGEAAPAWLGRQGLSARLVPCDGIPATVVGAWPRPALAEARHG